MTKILNAIDRIRHFQSIAMCTCTLAVLVGPTAQARPPDPISPDQIQLRIDELKEAPWSGRQSPNATQIPGGCNRTEVVIESVDPVNHAARPVHLFIARPDAEHAPVMVVVPTVDGVTTVEKTIASHFCNAGIAAIITDVIDRKLPATMPSWGFEDVVNRTAILQLRTVLDFAENSRYFDPDKMGLMGTSLGGIAAALIAGVEPQRLKAIVIAVGAGDYAHSLAYSNNDLVQDLREKRMKATGMTDPVQYEEALRGSIRYDPIYFAPRVDKDRILMVMAESDDVMPYQSQVETYEAFGHPSRELYSGGHLRTILSMTFLYFQHVMDFVRARFDGNLAPMDLHLNVDIPLNLEMQ